MLNYVLYLGYPSVCYFCTLTFYLVQVDDTVSHKPFIHSLEYRNECLTTYKNMHNINARYMLYLKLFV